MDIEQRYKILCQIALEYELLAHMDANREHYQKVLDIAPFELGGDLSLVDMMLNGESMCPATYENALWRARVRLGLVERKP